MQVVEDEADWALTEFGGAALGDARRTDRLVRLATVLGRRAHLSLPQACGGPAQLKAAYRFFAKRHCRGCHRGQSCAGDARPDRDGGAGASRAGHHLRRGGCRECGAAAGAHDPGRDTGAGAAGLLAQETWTRPPEEEDGETADAAAAPHYGEGER